MLILAVYTSAIAALVARVAQRRRAPALLWIVATAGVYAVCGGQAILAELFGGGAVLGGGWLQLAALGRGRRRAPHARAARPSRPPAALIHRLAPRLPRVVEFTVVGFAPPAAPQLLRFTRFARDRAPPALA